MNQKAYTLLETMIASTIAIGIFGIAVLGMASFQRVFAAGYSSYRAITDQTRVLDYIALDVRQALTGTVTSGTQMVVNVPIYTTGTNSNGKNDLSIGVPVNPTISSGTVSYGAATMAVTYATSTIAGSTAITRTCSTSAGTKTSYIANAGSGWTLSFSDPNDQSHPTKTFSLGGTTSITSVKATLTFQPHFNSSQTSLTSSIAGSMVQTTATMRNPH